VCRAVFGSIFISLGRGLVHAPFEPLSIAQFMSEFFVEPSWLTAVKGTRFYYPAADLDHIEALEVFQDVVDDFWFADTHYRAGLKIEPALEKASRFRLLEVERNGAINAPLERRQDERRRPFNYLKPSRLIERYEREDGRKITVVRRRGYGQIGLMEEFSEKGLGVFMHRGDSMGEAGSNVWFLANRKARYQPCGMLFDKLASRLADESLIVSDGSNCKINALGTFHNRGVASEDAFKHFQGRDFEFRGFSWSCVGWMSERYGPTLVWGLKRITR
jgi:hypothetical protein